MSPGSRAPRPRRSMARRLRAVFVCSLLVPTLAARGDEPSPGVGEAILASPQALVPGAVLRVVAVSDRPDAGALTLVAPDGGRLAATSERRGGPPYWWYLEVEAPTAGVYRACLEGAPATCEELAVGGSRPGSVRRAIWPVARDWSRATEALYSAWIEKLFDDPLDAEPNWRSLDEVTRQRGRNFLHDHLGLGEDGERGLRLAPDCADLPYFLRAYFAWKLGLPFGWSECDRGEGGHPPRCGGWHSNLTAVGDGGDALARMQRFFAHDVAWGVQSGAGRAPAEDEHTDFYPTRLAAAALRPGTVYADPYGHTLVLVRRVPQTTSSPGLLLAVDAQPDGTVARKRYWRGNFLFALDPSLGSPGFKHFRPIVREGRGLRPLANREILMHADWGDYAQEQYQSDVEGFYDRVDDVLSPEPLDAAVAFRAAIDALDEQIRTRIRAVANGEAFTAAHAGTIPMPEGAAIFETTGAWEDYATPSRDLRLLIAIDVVRGFPAKAAARPERFAARAADAPADGSLAGSPPAGDAPAGSPPADVRTELEAILGDAAAARRFEYTRSDGSIWTLTLGDVLDRTAAFEVAYDPNDCIEVRWGAPPGSPEAETCRRRAPADQIARMTRYRPWFHDRSRPPR